MSSQREVVKVILVTPTSRRGVTLNVNTTYEQFVTYVGKKFDLKMHVGYTLSYKLQQSDYSMEITDDDELSFFIEAARNSPQRPIEVFVLETPISQQTHHGVYKDVLGDMFVQKLKDPNRVYRPKDIIDDICELYHIKISYQQAWRSRECALEKLRDGHAESFNKLPYYFYNLKLKNPGTFTKIKTDQYGQFDMCFMMLGVSIRTFQKNLRPLIIVDGAHLKGKYKGSNLITVGMDGNNSIVPLAYGICSVESGITWTWFMSKLKQCIGEVPELVFISDRHLGIAQGVSKVFPKAFHGICCRHLLMNINLPKKKDWIFWKICKAHKVTEFNFFMEQLLNIDPKAYEKLNKVRFERWSRAHCPVNRYNYLTSNCVELVNSLSVSACKMPITMIMEFFRANYEKLGHILAPKAETKIYKRIRKSNMWQVHGITSTRYQVYDGRYNCLVDLECRECECKKWKHSGLPCGHVIAMCKENDIGNCADLAKHWFTLENYQATYVEKTIFVGDVRDWVIPDNFQVVLPPITNKRNAGRLKKTTRIPSQGERIKIKVCRRCGADDHESSQCRVSVTSTKSSLFSTIDLNEP
ncbi:uncharacterized protein [Rutidosis leptorrhynchoides]|uniref:uncharacterized protein n=1 Tax=Rutidosis leptorrhynchoides TaxID=125765 RepID=UPI003A99E273